MLEVINLSLLQFISNNLEVLTWVIIHPECDFLYRHSRCTHTLRANIKAPNKLLHIWVDRKKHANTDKEWVKFHASISCSCLFPYMIMRVLLLVPAGISFGKMWARTQDRWLAHYRPGTQRQSHSHVGSFQFGCILLDCGRDRSTQKGTHQPQRQQCTLPVEKSRA